MAEPTFAFAELLKLIVALGVTIGLFYALALFMKRLQVGTGKGGSLITVLAALPLGNKEKLWVVEVAGERLVIGTAAGSVNCLHILTRGGANRESGSNDSETELAEANAASFPRRRESIGLEQATTADMDSRPPPSRGQAPKAGNDGSATSESARGFAELLTKFRGWQK